MEMLVAAVGLFLVWIIVDKFNPAIEGGVDLMNGKIVRVQGDQETKNFKASLKNMKSRSKIYDDVLAVDHPVTAKDLKKLLDGKVKAED